MLGEWDVPGDEGQNWDGLSSLFHLFISNRSQEGAGVGTYHTTPACETHAPRRVQTPACVNVRGSTRPRINTRMQTPRAHPPMHARGYARKRSPR